MSASDANEGKVVDENAPITFWSRKTREQQDQVCTEGVIGVTDAEGNFTPSAFNDKLTGPIDWWYGLVNNLTMLIGFDFKALAYPPTYAFWEWVYFNICILIQSFNLSWDEMCQVDTVYNWFLNGGDISDLSEEQI